ncbi:MAG: S8 family serine peptidase [Verrucomicrobiae bacterium]|nr:S8 family serine peptidase [Verrucomicrobiae bacterium]
MKNHPLLRRFAVALVSTTALISTPQMSAQEYSIQSEGRTVVYEVAPDESPRQTASLNSREGTVLYPKGAARTQWNRRILTRKVLAKLNGSVDAIALTAATGAASFKSVSYAPDYHIFETGPAQDALTLSARLRTSPGVISAEPLLARQRQRRAVPNDPEFARQWHLLNSGQLGGTPGVDLNVTNVWDNYRGAGITINVVDDGLETDHPDLVANINTALGHDYRDNDSDPNPVGGTGATDGIPNADSHGTSVGGVIAARGNNGIGVAGVAYEATLVGVRLIGGNTTDDTDAAAILHSNAVVHISNNSWGPPDGKNEKGGVGPLSLAAMQAASTQGRGGLGTILVWAGGNGGEAGDNANYDGFNSSPYTVSVGALNDLGDKADYSERGSCLVVSAPSGGESSGRSQATATTDVRGDRGYNRSDVSIGDAPGELADRDYTQNFNGTSSATPMVSGVVALMLEANPQLGWRDVQEILIRSATRNSPANSDWRTNAAGLRFNPNYGAGLVNAAGAVQMSLSWNPLPAASKVTSAQTALDLAIPDDDANGLLRTFDLSASDLMVEHCQVIVTIEHPRRGDLVVDLISPAGTVSPLAELHSDPNPNYTAHRFLSVFNWGEDSRGTWQIRVADRKAGESGLLKDLQLEVSGSAPPVGALAAAGTSGTTFEFSVNGPAGIAYTLQATTNLVPASWFDVGAVVGAGKAETLTHPNALNSPRLFYRLAR